MGLASGVHHLAISTADMKGQLTFFTDVLGAELKALCLVMGQYDFVALVEAPDDITAAKVSLAWGAQGNVSSETLRAFTEEEFRSIVAALP